MKRTLGRAARRLVYLKFMQPWEYNILSRRASRLVFLFTISLTVHLDRYTRTR